MSFGLHPSSEMVALFQKKPYQGQDPSKAELIFLGSDANYSNAISNHKFFHHVLEYHADGVKFWQTHGQGRHHPFLLADYPFDRRLDGVVFHRNFNKIGLLPEHAPHISFLELLNVPTTGMQSKDGEKFLSLIEEAHINYIDALIQSDRPKLILLSSGVLRNMLKIRRQLLHRRQSVFAWLGPLGPGKVAQTIGGSEIIEIPHFSSTTIHAFLPTLREIILPRLRAKWSGCAARL